MMSDLPRRMWAGGRFEFHTDAPPGSDVTKRSTIKNIAKKSGRSGSLCFVTVLLMMHQIMVENVSEPVSIKDICGRLGVSEKQLRGRCMAAYNQTSSTYYQARRLEVGYHFVTNSQLTLTEIARTSGFESLSSFSRAMRVRYGFSPKRIRNRTSTS